MNRPKNKRRFAPRKYGSHFYVGARSDAKPATTFADRAVVSKTIMELSACPGKVPPTEELPHVYSPFYVCSSADGRSNGGCFCSWCDRPTAADAHAGTRHHRRCRWRP